MKKIKKLKHDEMKKSKFLDKGKKRKNKKK